MSHPIPRHRPSARASTTPTARHSPCTALVAAAAATLLSLAATAAAAQGRTDLGLVASTEGAGLEIAHSVTGLLRGRLSATGFSISESFSTDAVRYEGDADLRSAALLVDLSPFAGAFHLTAGVVFQDHDIRGTAPVEDLLLREFGPTLVDQARTLLGPIDFGTLEATAEVDSLAPYLGLGWRGNRKSSGMGLALDLGVIFYGEPDIEVTADTELPVDLIPGGDALLDAFLDEQERELQSEVDDYEVFPVVRFTLFWRF